jgi:hypothetical protein
MEHQKLLAYLQMQLVSYFGLLINYSSKLFQLASVQFTFYFP